MGNVTVWAKMVNESEIQRMSKNKEVIQNAAKKVVNGYLPPYVSHEPEVSQQGCINIIASEEMANHGQFNHLLGILQ